MIWFVVVKFRFWDEEVPFTPESRVAVHEHMKKLKQKDEDKKYGAFDSLYIYAFMLLIYCKVCERCKI